MATKLRQQIAGTTGPRIVGLGAGQSPDQRVTETADLHYSGADHHFDLRDDWPFEDNSVDGLIANHVLEHIRFDDYPHVFNEAHRVLTDSGWFEVRVPVGADQAADGSHATDWSWRFANRSLCDESAHWLPTIAFDIAEKELDVWMCGPAWPLTPVVRAGADIAPFEGWYELPGATGEMMVRFEVDK